MDRSESWYCRICGVTFGPLSLSQILHYIILKKVGEDDEVSNDGVSWQPLRRVKMLNPKSVLGLKGVLNDQQREYLEATLAWSDKYQADAVESGESVDRFSEVRRRGVSSANPATGYFVVILLIAAIIGVSLMIPKGNIEVVPDCTSVPAPAINWTNCRFEKAIFSNSDLQGATLRNVVMAGANLQASNLSNSDIAYADLNQTNLKGARMDGADLRGADLRQADLRRASLIKADLSFADMTGANLNGADLEGTNFSNTIWIDGKTCNQGSIGHCIKSF